MKLITDFYQSLDTLNLIIFWGIIVVIILLIIFSYLMITKNKKHKKTTDISITKDEEELPIKNEIEEITELEDNRINFIEPEINENKSIETETSFNAEEHIANYNKEETDNTIISNNEKQLSNSSENVKKTPIEMPTGPYQRNVLREMSLSQTSPIGINRIDTQKEKDNKIRMAKDLEQSLNENDLEIELKENQEKEEFNNKEITIQIKEELINQKQNSNDNRKTEIVDLSKKDYHIETPAKELLDIQIVETNEQKEKSSSAIYLEEVSKKLAEAEVPEDIERTNYELKQEEDAIISYTELMSKKDSIQTIDEEDAVISIEELMNRSVQNKTEEITQDEKVKLYNLTEEEENDNFIKELKQFRNDL